MKYLFGLVSLAIICGFFIFASKFLGEKVISPGDDKTDWVSEIPKADSVRVTYTKREAPEFKGEDPPPARPKRKSLSTLMADEPKVRDFVLTDAQVLYVSVRDDGTNRKGLAMYFCDLMAENAIQCNMVKVVEFGSMNTPSADNAYGRELGRHHCN